MCFDGAFCWRDFSGRHARIRRTIIDKGIPVPEGMEIGFNSREDRKKFTVTDTNIVVIPKEMRL
jgi:glucose-1-phosphate adenylyltransferase